jgi:preprotein translocase subunit SecD
MLCVSLMVGGAATAQGTFQSTDPMGFSIRIIDDRIDGNTQKGPPDEDRFPNSTRGIGSPGFLWLKRTDAITGDVISEAHVGAGADGQPVVLFRFTAEARDKFTALTRAILGQRLAFVLNGTIVTQALINGVMDGPGLQISGYFTEPEARELAAEMMTAIRPVTK